MNGAGRIQRCFTRLGSQRRSAFIPFITAGDPDYDLSLELLSGLPGAGADIIELGVPFSDPMADGPAIQASSRRALNGGQTLARCLAMVDHFRRHDEETPVILFGYFNPILAYGVERFVADAASAGVDGLLVVDLPPEEMDELRTPARAAGLSMILLVAPTTGEDRIRYIAELAEGFIYAVSIAGVTGTASATEAQIANMVERIRVATSLPIAVGFGIKTPAMVASVASRADAAVVGSALVGKIGEHVGANGAARSGLVSDVLSFVGQLAQAIPVSVKGGTGR